VNHKIKKSGLNYAYVYSDKPNSMKLQGI